MSVQLLWVPMERSVGHGYTHETGPADHAEQVALRRADENGANLEGATLYSSLEPCGARLSWPLSCVDLILESPIKRVVYALDEPPIFVSGGGAQGTFRQWR